VVAPKEKNGSTRYLATKKISPKKRNKKRGYKTPFLF